MEQLRSDPGVRFDYYCWDLYAEVSAHYKEHPEHLAWRLETLHAIEHRTGDLVYLAALIADTIVKCHLATMRRLGIYYDVLPRESEILQLHFWETAFQQLKERKAIYFETEGKNKGCWVMPASAFKEQTEEDTEDSKVIVRSNNTVTYVGKDIAYQLWKFGLLGKDFYYRPWGDVNGHPVYVTTAEPQAAGPLFGKGDAVYNVIDSRQSYLQDVVVAGLRALGYSDQADRSFHFSYEMVALSPRTCVELGIELSDDDKKKPYVEVSGRKGLGVKADDLIDKLIEKALEEVDARHPEAPSDERREVATEIAIGALRYFMLKFTRNSVIAFDFQEALSFEGETGPYVQYSAVRARNILRKLTRRGETVPDFARASGSIRHRKTARGRRTLATASAGIQSRFRGGSRDRFRGTRPRRQVRVPTGAGVQQFLSRVPGPDRGGPRETNIPSVDNRILPRSDRPNSKRAGHLGTRIHVASGAGATSARFQC